VRAFPERFAQERPEPALELEFAGRLEQEFVARAEQAA